MGAPPENPSHQRQAGAPPSRRAARRANSPTPPDPASAGLRRVSISALGRSDPEAALPNSALAISHYSMSNMRISLCDALKQRLRGLLLEGASSAPTEPVGETYFDALRERVRSREAE